MNGVLGLSDLSNGSYGYARIRRTAGVGAFTAYGVVNDARRRRKLPAGVPSRGLAAAPTVIVPVVLDVYGEAGSHYTTEVTLVNDGTIVTPVDLVYRPAPGFGEIAGVPVVTVDLAARQQVTIPDVLAYLRSRGMQNPDDDRGPGGHADSDVPIPDGIDAPSTVVLARTTTPKPTPRPGALSDSSPGRREGGRCPDLGFSCRDSPRTTPSGRTSPS